MTARPASEIGEALDGARDRLRETVPPLGPTYLTVAEVAQLARCEHKTVRKAITTGRLAAFQPAQKLLVREEDARGWIEARPAITEPSSRPRRGAGTRSSRPKTGSVSLLKQMERDA